MHELIDLIVENLGSYDYPGFHIKIRQNTGELAFGQNLRGAFVPECGPTDRRLDEYHYALLHSDSRYKNLAGLASVVYWGFASRGDGNARARARWLMDGHGGHPRVTADLAARCLAHARHAVACGAYGVALGEMKPLSQLGRTPFASKVIAFLCPDAAGVYDNRIQRGLTNHPVLARHASRGGCLNVAPTGSAMSLALRFKGAIMLGARRLGNSRLLSTGVPSDRGGGPLTSRDRSSLPFALEKSRFYLNERNPLFVPPCPRDKNVLDVPP
jgi:hypothetical protein